MKVRSPRICGDIFFLPLTRGKEAVLDIVDIDLAQFNWNAVPSNGTWYARRGGGPRSKEKKKIILHREVAKRAGMQIDGLEVDHADGDGLNCRRLNLRPATDLENARNGRIRRQNTSGYKGVTWCKRNQKWLAQIGLLYSKRHLGYFDTREEAARAYTDGAAKYHGNFARVA